MASVFLPALLGTGVPQSRIPPFTFYCVEFVGTLKGTGSHSDTTVKPCGKNPMERTVLSSHLPHAPAENRQGPRATSMGPLTREEEQKGHQ